MTRLKIPDPTDAAEFARRFRDDVWLDIARAVCSRHDFLRRSQLERSPRGENVIFFAGDDWVIKIYGPERDQFRREHAALKFAERHTGVPTPEVCAGGEIDGWPYLITTRLKGVPLGEAWGEVAAEDRVRVVESLGHAMSVLHRHDAPVAPALRRDWRAFVESQARGAVERQRACGANPEWLASLPAFLEERLPLLPADFEPALLHGDVHPGNVLLAPDAAGRWRVSGLFDFADSFVGFREYEFVAPGVLMVQGDRELQRALLSAYGYAEAEMDERLRARLMLLTVLYECSDLGKYARRLSPAAERLTLSELERAVWKFDG